MTPRLSRGKGAGGEEALLVVTFDSTASALSLGECAAAHGLDGRLAPIPRSLSADCGASWREPAANERLLRHVLHVEGIEHREILRLET